MNTSNNNENRINATIDWQHDEEFVKELNERVRRYNEGIDKAYSWNELEVSIDKLKEKRIANKLI